MVIETLYHFIDSNLGVEISSKKRGQQKKKGSRRGEGGGVLEVVLLGEGPNDLTWRGKGLPAKPGVGVNCTN